MTSSIRTIAILLAIAAQVAVLGGMLVNASLPLWTGTEVKLRTVPVDPRSLFRGNYARLNYDISRLPVGTLAEYESLRPNEVVYVTLRQNPNGIYEFEAASLTKPEAGVFIKGRYRGIRRAPNQNNIATDIDIEYGIEAYFAPVEEALELERTLRSSGAIAHVMVSRGGKPALKAISSNP